MLCRLYYPLNHNPAKPSKKVHMVDTSPLDEEQDNESQHRDESASHLSLDEVLHHLLFVPWFEAQLRKSSARTSHQLSLIYCFLLLLSEAVVYFDSHCILTMLEQFPFGNHTGKAPFFLHLPN